MAILKGVIILALFYPSYITFSSYTGFLNVFVILICLDKLTPRLVFCIFYENSQTQKSYLCYDPVSHYYFINADVTFFESTPYFSKPEDVTITQLWFQITVCNGLFIQSRTGIVPDVPKL